MAQNAKKLSLSKRVAGLLFIGFVSVISFTVTLLIVRLFASPTEPSQTTEPTNAPAIIGLAAVTFIVGCFLLTLCIAAYAITIATKCFTFDFNKPFWNSVKKKLYFMHIVVTLLLTLAVAAFVSVFAVPFLVLIGLPLQISVIVPLLGTLVLIQFLTVWFNIWQPLEKSITQKRLLARGISQEVIDKGLYIGISDPAKSSLKKMTMIEEDVGMFWFGNEELVYNGDTESFRIKRDQLIAVERKADAGGVSTYFGNVNVIIRFNLDDGTERLVRLHNEGQWTMSRAAKASNALADKLARWKQWSNQPKTSSVSETT